MEQTKAINALAPFVALTKSAIYPRAAVDLIERATSAPNTFVFAELLEAPEIQALADSEGHSSHLRLLEIFSYGTYRTYCESKSLPNLNDAQTTKLRQLSILTLARNPANLSYDKLMSNLGLNTQQELENLVISVIYAGLMECTLDPYNRRVIVTSISPLRDLEPNSALTMLKTLDEWSVRCQSTLTYLEKQINSIKADVLKRQRLKIALDTEIDTLVEGRTVKSKEVNMCRTEMGFIGNELDAVHANRIRNERFDDEAMDIDNVY
ncbi:COP9 signalosome complex subunit 7a [Golovinomyces cichoracearum]|uniref:COP9 signalosome complex subunit 7a n=1 Tax=Golovinomyces cichoracearum TaxID=62708 RepID=A0A420IXT1_9PEZI|nr:COP9 signalosome complex subunit 7a [Golovinomyces cichoracearum]